MKARTIIIVSLLLLTVSSCTSNGDDHKDNTHKTTTANSHDGFTLRGKITGGEGKRLCVEEIGPKETMFIDSLQIDGSGYY